MYDVAVIDYWMKIEQLNHLSFPKYFYCSEQVSETKEGCCILSSMFERDCKFAILYSTFRKREF